ncbi:MAG: gamma-glutamyltransferase family protein [Acidiferrobacterales bacterium]
MLSHRPVIRGTRHVVAAGHYLAAHAGFAVLEAGGNAVDAGVAAGLVEGVVESDQVNVAGVAPIIMYLADRREVITISGLGTWPRAASCEFFQREHGGEIPAGILRTVVPAAPAAWVLALERFGTMSFGDVASAAIRLARDGFPIHPYTAEQIRMHADEYRRWPSNAEIYLPGGQAPAPGELFVQKDLAKTLQYMVDEEKAAAVGGRAAGLQAVHDAFYRGDIAQTTVRFHQENGGLLGIEDLAQFKVDIEPPAHTRFHDLELYTCSFWCQGPVLLQALNILSGFDLAELGHNTKDYIHVLAEGLKLAFADRHRYYGDPRFVDVPTAGLLSLDYAAQRRTLIRPDQAWPEMPPAGDPRALKAVLPGSPITPAVDVDPPESRDTTYVCALDKMGNVFSVSPSDTSSETVVIPGTGLCPSARGTQSWADADHPACVAPGKRPRLTPNPALALRDGNLFLAFGTPGGDTQPQSMLQALLNITVFAMDPQAAVEAPRFMSWSFPNSRSPHSYHPGLLTLESRIPGEIGDALATLGHKIKWWPERTPQAGGVCIVRYDFDTGVFHASADHRRAGYAVGW